MSDDDKREVIRQESFWFTVTTLGFTGFVGSLLKDPSPAIATIAWFLIFILWLFTVYLLVDRHKEYRRLNKEEIATWGAALRKAMEEHSGTLYCIGVVTLSMLGFSLIIWLRAAHRCTP